MLKALAAWFGMLLLSVANGTLRDFTYGRHLDELTAHQYSTLCSVLVLSAFIFWFVRRWPPASSRQALMLGLGWTALTVAFEFLFFHYVVGHSWDELLGNYNVLKGRSWVAVLLCIALAPYVFRRLRRPTGSPPQSRT